MWLLKIFQAAFHVQYNNIKSGDCAPFSSSAVKQAIHHLDGDIQLLAKRQDWISVHRLLLTRNLIAQVRHTPTSGSFSMGWFDEFPKFSAFSDASRAHLSLLRPGACSTAWLPRLNMSTTWVTLCKILSTCIWSLNQECCQEVDLLLHPLSTGQHPTTVEPLHVRVTTLHFILQLMQCLPVTMMLSLLTCLPGKVDHLMSRLPSVKTLRN